MGLKPHHTPTDITRAKVASLIAFGNTHVEIAEYLGISDDALVKHYAEELRTAKIEANERVANRLFAKAVEQDDLQAQIFWLKTRARWRTVDKDEQQNTINSDLQKQLAELRVRLEMQNKKEY